MPKKNVDFFRKISLSPEAILTLKIYKKNYIVNVSKALVYIRFKRCSIDWCNSIMGERWGVV